MTRRAAAALTARGIKAMLTRSGVDRSGLDIHDGGPVRSGSLAGKPSVSVVIEGPKEARTKAFHALFDRGLTVAPYPDHDEWTRL